MPTTTAPEVAAYASAVREALSDLQPADIRALLDGLDEHLAEVAADGEVALVDALGPPHAYAAELRASAGLPTRVAPPTAAFAAPAPPPPPAPSPPPSTGAVESIDSVRHWPALRTVLAAAVIGLLVLIVAIAVIGHTYPITVPRVLFGAAVIGAASALAFAAIRESGLSSVGKRRIGVGMVACALIGAVWLGGHFANDRTRDAYYPYSYPFPIDMVTVMTLSAETTLPAVPPVTITAPFAEIVVPDVLGMSSEAATGVLQQLSISYEVMSIDTTSVAAGAVADQSIAPGSVVQLPATVVLFVSSGEPGNDTSVTASTVPVAEPTYETMAPATTVPSRGSATGASTTTAAGPTSTVAAPTSTVAAPTSTVLAP